MFCGKCGTQNADDATVCVNCGAELKKKEAPKKPEVKLDNGKIGKIAVAAVVVILAFILFSGRSYKSVVNKYISARFDTNAKAIVDLAPSKVVKYLKDEDEYDYTINYANKELQYINSILCSYYFDDENFKVSHKIIEQEDYSKDDLEYLQSNYEQLGIKVKAAKDIEVEVTLKSNGKEGSDTYYFTVIKVGKSWYLDISSINDIF